MANLNDPNIIYKGELEEFNEYATVGDLLIQQFKKGADKVSLINGYTDEKWSFNDLLRECIKMAKVLHGVGVRQNDVISIVSENRLEYLSISYAVMFLNAILAPINTEYTERELIHTLDITKPKYVFISAFNKNKIGTFSALSCLKKIILMDGENFDDGRQISLKNLVKKYDNTNFDVEAYVRKPVKLTEQTVIIFMSSGTTGLPKGVELSHGNFISCAINNLERIKIPLQIFGETSSLLVAPWFHAMGFMSSFLYVTSAAMKLVFLYKFDPEFYLKSIEKYKIFMIAVVPPIMLFLAKTPLFDKYNLSSLKIIGCGAASLTSEIEEQVKKRFKDEIIIYQAYGQTEATLGVLYAEIATLKPGSVGEIIKGMFAKVVDETGKSLGPNKVGELCFKGPLLMKGYRNNKNATSEIIDKDGWLHSGDLGYYDEDKQFFIVDRLKELIKFKGYQVAPAELEGFLVTNPKIKDAGVIGIPDEKAGELPFAFIVKESNSDLTEEEVKQFVANNLSNPKWLRGGVKFVDEIPKSITGKILRRQMKELYKSMKAKL